MAWMLNLLSSCCGFAGFGEELYKDWDNHPAAQQYTFLKRLGEGGFSEVQLARDNLTGKTVALKIVFLNKAGLRPEEKRILGGEAKLLRMVAHPNIIRCSRILETQRQQVLVLEHLSGGEMLQQLQRVKRYTEAHACQLFRQIVDAMAYLHSLGIMHRDIKPENCLLAKPASHYKAKSKPIKVKLIDLGMAGLYRPRKPLYGCMGSPGFIAPEVVLGEAHTPAMDVYSLGVLLFIMLVGRKPWDAQRSHTLQYAVEATADAPGLQDQVFTALSPAAQQLVILMLAEDPGDRPSAGQVVNHAWMLQGIKAPADGSPTTAPERLIQPAVQQRLRMLGNSRQIMGTARGMMLLHSRGSRTSAVAFHKAVKEARNKLQQQAALLKAAGQIPDGSGTPFSAAAIAGNDGVELQQRQLTPCGGAPRPASAADVAARCASAVNRPGPGITASLARPVSYSDPLSAAAQTTAAAAADQTAKVTPLALRRKSAIGDLARASLQQQSLLFTGPQRPPAVQAAAVAATAAGHAKPARAASGEAPALGTRVGVGAHYAAPDTVMVAEALARGMSVPEPDLPFSVPNDLNAHRFDRAVTLSPGALALLDADDRMCLLAASQDDDDGAALFSWNNRRGAADMIQSFKDRYPVKQAALPLVRSLAKFGTSLGRSLRHNVGGLSSHHGGMFSPRAVRLGSGDVADGLTTPRPADTAITADGLLSPRQSTARLLSASSGEDLTPDLEPASADGAAQQRQQQQRRRSSDAGSSSGGAARGLKKTASVRFADEAPTRSASKQDEQSQQQAEQQEAVQTPRGRRPTAAAALKAAACSNSATEALELALLGTQMSFSPPLSPVLSATAATPVVRSSSDRGIQPALETEPETPRPTRPTGAAAAAAANKHFRQQQQQKGKQQVFVMDAQQLPLIPSEKSVNASSADSAAEDASAVGKSARVGRTGVLSDQEQRAAQEFTAQQPPISPGSQADFAAAPIAASAVQLHQDRAAAVLPAALASKRALLNINTSNTSGSNSRNTAVSRAPFAAAGARVPAAAAPAVGYEEEGLNLPNGLWLQQSQTLSEAGLLSPRIALATGYGVGLGLELTAARSLSSAAESPRTLGVQDSMLNVAFAESLPSDNYSGDQLATTPTVAATTAAVTAAAEDGRTEAQQRSTRSSDADPWSQQQEKELQEEQQGIVHSGATESEHAQYSRRSAADRHTRDVSITNWLDPGQESLSWQAADGDLGNTAMPWPGAQETQAQAAATNHTEAAGSSPKQQQQSNRSRQVAVPSSVASSSRHGQGKSYRRWSNNSQHQRHTRPKRVSSCEEDPGLSAAAAAAGVSRNDSASNPADPATSAAADVSSSAAEQTLGQNLGTEGQTPEQGFYVGSYSNAEGLSGNKELEFDDTLGSDGLSPDDIEGLVVDELRHAAEQGWGGESLPTAVAAAPGLSKVVAATVAKVLRRSFTAGAAAALSGGTTATGVDQLGQDEVDLALQIGLDEVTSSEQPLSTESDSNPAAVAVVAAAAAVVADNSGNSLKAATTKAGRPPAGQLTAAVGTSKLGAGTFEQQPTPNNSNLVGAWPGSNCPGRHSNADAAPGPLPIKSQRSRSAQLRDDCNNRIARRPIPIAKGNKILAGRGVGAQPRVYDDFDEPTAW